MELTKEQVDIIKSEGNIKINAVAGSGKTTTIIEYAKTRQKNSRILYLAFNKSVKLEAVKKFTDKGLNNVKVETAHSLAYKHIVFRNNYTVRPQGYKTYEIAELLGLRGNGEKHSEYIVANHINKFIAYFCNSDKPKVQDLNYLETVFDAKAKVFVTSFYEYIEKQTRLLLGKMNKGEIEITHDFYLKKFQLLCPKLGYDYILFDEGQDASPAMLDVFLNQDAVKVIVGDTNQQIYSWRFAVNSLEKVNFKNYNLSISFRFSQDIADLAMEILKWKNHIGLFKTYSIAGKGITRENKNKAVLARTNLGLLIKAIEHAIEKRQIKRIYFEGNINSYTYAEEGASLYDVLNLYNGKRRLIRDTLIKKMRDIEELEDYVKKTEDAQLGMMVEIVKEYDNEIPRIIKEIKDKHVDNDEKEKADMIFSTVHRCKGMEYDSVQIADDFIDETKLEKIKSDDKEGGLNISKLNEEINLLYVAVTRTKNILNIPENLYPKSLLPSSRIYVIPKDMEEIEKEPDFARTIFPKQKLAESTNEKTYSFEKVREKHKEAYQPWTEESDDKLTVMYCEGFDISEIAERLGRTKGAIRSRIRKLELEDLYGERKK